MSLLVHGARKLDADGVVDGFWLLGGPEGILEVGTGEGWRARSAEVDTVADAQGAWLTPGFLDLHCHGAGGSSFDDGADAIRSGLAVHRAHGTTRSVVSLVSAPLPTLADSLSTVADLCGADPLVIGAHLEGPFLSPDRRGAHDPAALRSPTPLAVAELLEAADGHLTQITIAPELPGAPTAIEAFAAEGVIVAVGHTDADLRATRDAFDRGARLVTHAFNAMPGIHHRSPGPLPAAFDDERVVLELIVDGLHVDPAVVQLAFRAAPGRVAMVTDAMAAAGASDGHYHLGSRDVDVREGRAVLEGTDTLAGSTLTQDAALRIAVTECGIEPVEAIRALTRTPATVLRRHDLGLLRPGCAADVVLLSPGFEVRGVAADGVWLTPPTQGISGTLQR
ncbi:N-acetylglucosamine-6-phosphate deacetylase [Cnuibacter physcomitrellae]|uniref:N-acetylglucosamine-6-phosphate deacetylase n=1 Tax=Cnuibacter physcomitrellae TaxID=1619308 RepID=A0A1X9LHJ3_9MICO|nr:N-acetylglucosamine-6-phosphate deacetylase [Cnuibacter physcomitrellae]ARJ04676.1 N-acetylglucosamine-6-phosphate deacetylase [Cnuibacter physcomitrellae]GGI42155.1 N-acetylglucosamine-6-phosphate deacetylase [Cnuibacter physcomitrellae]